MDAQVAVTAPHEIALLRLAAQRLAGPGMATATEAVRWLTAMQAQNRNGIFTSVALRTASATEQAVRAACTAGQIVKSWPMRGTLHLVPAEDLRWMLDLAAPRVVAAAATRRARLGLDTTTLERARELAVDALAGGRACRREEMLAVWDRAGLTTSGQRGYHLLWHLAQTATLCFGPMDEGHQLLVLVDEWITRPRRPERDEALGELALRYFRGHGPATVRDFSRWTNLVAADVRAALALARPELNRIDVEGTEYLMDPRTPDLLDACRPQARGVFLLPGFDELILGYADRGAVLRAEFAQRVVPGANGMFLPTIVADGEVVGTWKHTGRGPRRTMAAAPFESLSAKVAEAVTRAYAALP